MTLQKSFLFILISYLANIQAIWPPAYKIDLKHDETFIISEVISSDDSEDLYSMEDEMIREDDLKKFNLEGDSKKYSRLHKLSARKNSENTQKERKSYKKRSNKPKESNYDHEDKQPWEAGFVDKNGKFKTVNKIVSDQNNFKEAVATNKSERNKTETRREVNSSADENYDYDALKAEYESNIKADENSEETLKYTEIKEEESLAEAVKVAVIGKPEKERNCSVEEKTGIGLKAAKCMVADLTNPNLSQKDRSVLFHRIVTIILIWILVYLLVAIPCWCQKGWCCCCFQCKFCKPQQRIDVAKKYLLDNPLGVYHSPDNETFTLTPTNYEKYAQQRLEKALMKI